MVWQSRHVLVAENEVERACQWGGEESVTVKFGSEAVVVRGNHIHHTAHEGIDVKEGCHNVRVHGNHIHHVERQGLYADAWNRDTGEIEFFNNLIHDCGFGMVAGAETGGLLHDVSYYNNVVYNCEGPGIAVADWGSRRRSQPMRNIRFLNNTIHNCGADWGGGILFENAEAEEVIVRNNILSRCGPPVVFVKKQPRSRSMDHNLFDAETQAAGEGAVFGDPKFADPEAGDFHLQNGSPAVDAGSADGAPDFDMDGETRPAGEGVDIGADELTRRPGEPQEGEE
jgi:polygalacturonase